MRPVIVNEYRMPLSCSEQHFCSATTALEKYALHQNVTQRPFIPCRSFSSCAAVDDEQIDSDGEDEIEREKMYYDVLIIGGGPSGLSAAIKLAQLVREREERAEEEEEESSGLSICVIEKGNEIGSHILSGNVFEPRGLDELLPDWRNDLLSDDAESVVTPVTKDEFLFLTEDHSFSIPNALLPSQLHNDKNYILSLSQLCRYLAQTAEDEYEIEIYPGFAASEVLYNANGDVIGVGTRDAGISKDGSHKDTFEPGMELHARQTLFAEGARGSCSEEVMQTFNLRDNCNPQTFGLGIKEVWEIPAEQHDAGLAMHTVGYPLQASPLEPTFGGTFLYHQAPNLIHCGMVIGLDYPNPYLNPYQEFQRWKTHPNISKILKGGECVSYGARVLNEGGLHSIPKLTFPGGCLIGCSAGFLNSVKIKGSHTAIKSGILAAEAIYGALEEEELESVAETEEIEPDVPRMEVSSYESSMKDSWIYDELRAVRNTHASFAYGFLPGMIYTGLATHLFRGKEPWTLSHATLDSQTTAPAQEYEPIAYPKPDGVLTFDLLTNLQRSGTHHDDDQPSHLKIKDTKLEDGQPADCVPEKISMQVYGAPEIRFCPAGVYEYVDDDTVQNETKDDGGCKKKLVINAQNCIHCKCCSIKMPHEYIKWTVPEGGGGPQYQIM